MLLGIMCVYRVQWTGKGWLGAIMLMLAGMALCSGQSVSTNGSVVLVSGPMLGAVTMRDARIWVQTSKSASVQVAFWPQQKPEERQITRAVVPQAENDFTATLEVGLLMPGTIYGYEVLIDGQGVTSKADTFFETPPNFRERFPAPGFSFAIGSGHYINDRPFDPLNRIPGSGYEIFGTIRSFQPRMMLWLGNTAYLREGDQYSQMALRNRYREARFTPELQPVLSSIIHLATWSGADYGPPNADKRGYGRDWALRAFKDYWPNNWSAFSDDVDGVAHVFEWSDCAFYFLDDRFNRDLTQTLQRNRSVFGAAQLDWLLDSMERSPAVFKFVCSGTPVLTPAESAFNATAAPDERTEFIEALRKRRINGVVFLSGGKPFGELTKMVRANAYDLWEMTVGPMTGRPSESTEEVNYFRMPSTATFRRHFGHIIVGGEEGKRKVTLSAIDGLGKEIWSETLSEESMSF